MTTTDSRASRFFDRYAGDFDAIYGNDRGLLDKAVNRLFRRAMLVRYEKTLAGCQPIAGRTALDVGCGPGHYACALAKRGAARVLGLDFAPAMLDLARRRAVAECVSDRTTFELGDFLTFPLGEPFDYAVIMGVMDYVREPERFIERVRRVVRGKAFFSFPADGGLLAWQRKLRYRSRCELYMYTEERLHQLMSRSGCAWSVESIGRDFFVTLTLPPSS